VAQAAVLPLPDAEHATRLQAFVRPAGSAGPEPSPDAAQLRAWLSRRLPAYMVPESIVIRAELPTTSTGKIDRQRLTRATAV
jgi:acyl-CoA synthetase (AMP-forming)/AMP-acid ligase II